MLLFFIVNNFKHPPLEPLDATFYSSCQNRMTVTPCEVSSTPAPILNHERARHKTALTSLQITLMMKPDRQTEEQAGSSDK